VLAADWADCAVLVAINSILQLVLFAPLGILFIRVFDPSNASDVNISYSVVAQSVGARWRFLSIKLTRFRCSSASRSPQRLRLASSSSSYCDSPISSRSASCRQSDRALQREHAQDSLQVRLSLIALLFTIIVIFAGQGDAVVRSITNVLRVAAPLLVYFIVRSASCRRHCSPDQVIFFAALFACRRLGFGYRITGARDNSKRH